MVSMKHRLKRSPMHSGNPETASIENLATKQDLRELETKLTGDMKALETKLTVEMKLIKWMMGFVLAGVAALILKSFFA